MCLPTCPRIGDKSAAVNLTFVGVGLRCITDAQVVVANGS